MPTPSSVPTPTYVHTRRLFLRLLGVVWVLAFASLATQVAGLVGDQGIMPAGAGDTALRLVAWSGAVLGVLLVLGLAPLPVLFLLWALYLSLSVAGQDFLAFQWDALLLETGLLAMLWAPAGWRLGRGEHQPSPLARLLLVFLLFKLMFLSGATKLVSGDPTWHSAAALDFHFETQPLPPWTAWYAHHLPGSVHRLLTLLTLAIEVVIPWMLLLPRRFRTLRIAGAAAIVLLQLGIMATGNYGFFNLLTIVLCVPVLDDRLLARLRLARDEAALEPERRRPLMLAVAPLIFLLSGLSLVRELAFTVPGGRGMRWWPEWADATMQLVAPLRSINGYGLFRVMTIERPEIVLEGSADGQEWRPYDFRYKPDAVTERPRFVAPFHPRLDWQLWFAALSPVQSLGWLETLAERLRAGTPAVLDLLGRNPFPAAPPKYVRAVLYDYRFSTPDERRRTGAWWVRVPLGTIPLGGTQASNISLTPCGASPNVPRIEQDPNLIRETPMRPLVLLTSLALAAACGDTTSPTTAAPVTEAAQHRKHHKPDLRKVRESLIAAGNAVSAAVVAEGVPSGLGGAFAHHGILLSPRQPIIRGRDAVTSFLASNPDAPSAMSWEVIMADVSADASQGFTWAQGASTLNLGNGPESRPSFFLIYWRRGDGGRWRIAAFVFNLGGPQALPLPSGFGTPDHKRGRTFHGSEKQVRRKMFAADVAFSAYSVAHGTGPAFERFAAPKAMAAGSAGLIFGPAAIGEAFTGEAGDTVSWAPRFGDVARSGDLGFTVGEATFDLISGVLFYSKYLTVWQRQKNGKWKYIADLGNSRPAPAP